MSFQEGIVDLQSEEVTNVSGQNLQICLSTRWKQFDISTADWLILIFKNNTSNNFQQSWNIFKLSLEVIL